MSSIQIPILSICLYICADFQFFPVYLKGRDSLLFVLAGTPAQKSAAIKTIYADIQTIVNNVSSPANIPSLLTATYRKWTEMGQAEFAKLWKTRTAGLIFSRAHVPNGWPIVDILESFNKFIKQMTVKLHKDGHMKMINLFMSLYRFILVQTCDSFIFEYL